MFFTIRPNLGLLNRDKHVQNEDGCLPASTDILFSFRATSIKQFFQTIFPTQKLVVLNNFFKKKYLPEFRKSVAAPQHLSQQWTT
jgi:hypothetical protein